MELPDGLANRRWLQKAEEMLLLEQSAQSRGAPDLSEAAVSTADPGVWGLGLAVEESESESYLVVAAQPDNSAGSIPDSGLLAPLLLPGQPEEMGTALGS